jgi:O-antigen/teichoic acid export membrane protein
MKKKFFINLVLLLLLNLLIKPIYIFGIERTVQNITGAAEYGIYFSLFSLSLILNIILDLGLTNYNNRNIARHNHLIGKYFSDLFTIKIILAFIYAIVCISIASIMRCDERQFHLIYFLILNQFLLSLILYFRSNINGLLLFITDSFLSVLDRLLMILICSVLIWGHIFHTSFRIEWFVYAQTISYLVTAIIAFLIVISKAGHFGMKLNYRQFLVILKQSYPFALLVLLMASYNRFDGLMLSKMLADGNVQAGIYAQAFRILDAATMFAFLFTTLLLPIFSKMLNEKQDITGIVLFSYSLIMVAAITFSFSSLFYADDIMKMLYHEHLQSSSIIYGILMIGFMAISTTYIFGTLLTANGNLRELNLMAGFALALNVGLNLVLIPRYKAAGAAVASLVTQSFTAIVQILLTCKILHFRFGKNVILRFLLFTGLVIGMGFFCKFLFSNWIYGFGAMLVLSAVGALLTGMINIRGLFNLLKFQTVD